MKKNTGNKPGYHFNLQFNFKLPKEEAPRIGKGIAVIVISFFINIFFMVFSTVRFIKIENYTAYNILFFSLIIGLAIGFIAIAIFAVQRYIIIVAIKSGYKYMTPFFKTVSAFVAERFAQDENFLRKLNKAFNIGDACSVLYDSKAPWIVKKAISFFINRIPFVKFITNLSIEGIDRKDVRAVSESVYRQMDEYLINDLFKNNTLLKAAVVLLIANIAVLSFIVCLIK